MCNKRKARAGIRYVTVKRWNYCTAIERALAMGYIGVLRHTCPQVFGGKNMTWSVHPGSRTAFGSSASESLSDSDDLVCTDATSSTMVSSTSGRRIANDVHNAATTWNANARGKSAREEG